MKSILTGIAAILFAFGLGGCGGDHDDHGHDHGPGAHEEHAGHDDHEGHDEHEDHGERHELGTADCGAFKVTVAVLGEIEAGAEGVLDIDVEGGTPAAVRAWVGIESGAGSMKAKIEGDHGYHGHIEVPATLPEGAQVWIEVEDADGKKSTASFDLE